MGPFNAKVKAQPLINVNRSGKLTTLNMCKAHIYVNLFLEGRLG